MGKRGPVPSPTALKVVRGERRDRINTREPTVPTGDVVPPTWMGSHARQEWDRLAPILVRMRVLTQIDRDALAVYCEAVAHYEQAVQLVDQSAVLISGQRGLVKNPAMQVARDQAAIIRAFGRELGLTPSSRSEMVNGATDRPQPGDDLLTG
jgi:P27 family predicted phage terminase small subunit